MATYLDIRQRLAAEREEAQGNEGGSNEYENCVPAGELLQMKLYGNGDPHEPQEVTDQEYRPNYHGGESAQASIDFVERLHPQDYPHRPPQKVEIPADLEGRMIQCAKAGWGMNIFVFCNRQAIINAAGPYQHNAVVARVADEGVTLWAEGFYGGQVDLSWAQLRADYAGGLWVFHAPYPFLLSAPAPPVTPSVTPPPPTLLEVIDVEPQDPRQGVSYFPGLFEGTPGPYEARDCWVALFADERMNGKTGTVSLRVYFVPDDYEVHGGARAADFGGKDYVTLNGSQGINVQSPIPASQSATIVQVKDDGTEYAPGEAMTGHYTAIAKLEPLRKQPAA